MDVTSNSASQLMDSSLSMSESRTKMDNSRHRHHRYHCHTHSGGQFHFFVPFPEHMLPTWLIQGSEKQERERFEIYVENQVVEQPISC